MKTLTREELRGKPLDLLCWEADTTTYEYGGYCRRVYCMGFYNAITDEPEELCACCGAFIRNNTWPEVEEGGPNYGA